MFWSDDQRSPICMPTIQVRSLVGPVPRSSFSNTHGFLDDGSLKLTSQVLRRFVFDASSPIVLEGNWIISGSRPIPKATPCWQYELLLPHRIISRR